MIYRNEAPDPGISGFTLRVSPVDDGYLLSVRYRLGTYNREACEFYKTRDGAEAAKRFYVQQWS